MLTLILWAIGVYLVATLDTLVHECGHFLLALLIKASVVRVGIGDPRSRLLYRWHWKSVRFTLFSVPGPGCVEYPPTNTPPEVSPARTDNATFEVDGARTFLVVPFKERKLGFEVTHLCHAERMRLLEPRRNIRNKTLGAKILVTLAGPLFSMAFLAGLMAIAAWMSPRVDRAMSLFLDPRFLLGPVGGGVAPSVFGWWELMFLSFALLFLRAMLNLVPSQTNDGGRIIDNTIMHLRSKVSEGRVKKIERGFDEFKYWRYNIVGMLRFFVTVRVLLALVWS